MTLGQPLDLVPQDPEGVGHNTPRSDGWPIVAVPVARGRARRPALRAEAPALGGRGGPGGAASLTLTVHDLLLARPPKPTAPLVVHVDLLGAAFLVSPAVTPKAASPVPLGYDNNTNTLISPELIRPKD